ncbi:MAG: hypothetical protein J5800_04650 [Spirochaetales bacterium]|nr:hypothetical protein [Spirochaetales bacterium]MBR4426262.1 hypothetical protein [Spirochaetales bacterium]
MTRKTVLVLCLCVLALSCAYAGKASLVAQISPYSLQSVFINGGTYTSTYGFGIEGGFRYDVWHNVSLGVDVQFDLFKYNEIEGNYTVIGVKAVGGYRHNFSDSFFVNGELGLGVDFRKVVEQAKPYLGMDAFIGCGYALSSMFRATGGVDLGLSFQKGENVKSTDFMVKTKIGMIMAL